MARPLWSGSLSFGLVNVPVEMVSAVRDRDVHFHQVRREGGERIELRRVASADEKRVAWEETAKGWETDDGEMIVLTSEDLAAAAPEATGTIDIEQFVELDEIDPVFFKQPYWLLPTGKGAGPARAYRLLVDTMAEAGKVAIGTVVMRAKQHLVALREQDGLLSLTTMHFADEIRDPDDVPAIPRDEESEPDDEAIDDAVALIGELTDDFDPEQYEDEHRKRLLALIDEKRKTGEVTIPEPEPEPKPQKAPADLVKALEESLERARAGSKS
ncbi:MAG: Ku protein [Patulibacter sp.]|nr:Ku protein [Patulibacter sp.]